jgi:hypothetical protein
MPTNIEQIIQKLPARRRKKIEARAHMLIAEEMTRQQLRQALRRTQVEIAHELGINQDSVSRLEQRADILISTLRGYIEAMGGRLSIIAEFPNHVPVRLSGIAENNTPALTSRRPRRAKARVLTFP